MRARDNPFTAQRIHGLRYRLDAAGWQDLLERWQNLGCKAALVGSHGGGKTTLLDELARRLASDGWRIRRGVLHRGESSLTSDQRTTLFGSLKADDLVLLDGADELGTVEWWRFRRAVRGAGGLLVTSHGEGRLPTLRRCLTSSNLLADLIGELHPEAKCDQPTAAALFRRHRGNLREALWELYHLHAGGLPCVGLAPDVLTGTVTRCMRAGASDDQRYMTVPAAKSG